MKTEEPTQAKVEPNTIDPSQWQSKAIGMAAEIVGMCGPSTVWGPETDEHKLVKKAEEILAAVPSDKPCDAELLDYLEKRRTKGRKVRLVDSGLGKGWRLHETERGYDSVREALIACLRPELAPKIEPSEKP